VRKKSLTKLKESIPGEDTAARGARSRAHRDRPQQVAGAVGSPNFKHAHRITFERLDQFTADGYAPFSTDRRDGRRAWESVARSLTLAKCLLRGKPGCSRSHAWLSASRSMKNPRTGERMRDNRPYGSEGGEARAFPTGGLRPRALCLRRCHQVRRRGLAGVRGRRQTSSCGAACCCRKATGHSGRH